MKNHFHHSPTLPTNLRSLSGTERTLPVPWPPCRPTAQRTSSSTLSLAAVWHGLLHLLTHNPLRRPQPTTSPTYKACLAPSHYTPRPTPLTNMRGGGTFYHLPPWCRLCLPISHTCLQYCVPVCSDSGATVPPTHPDDQQPCSSTSYRPLANASFDSDPEDEY